MRTTTHLYEQPNHTTIHFAFRWWLLLILLLFLKSPTGCQGCELEIEVFESLDDCSNGDAIGSGRIVADGTCRETSSVSPSSSDHLLPGIYRAVCAGSDRVTFEDSGCDDRSCSRSDRGVCDGDNSVESYIYARVDRDTLSLETCYILTYNNSDGDDLTVYFFIYGSCDCGELVKNGETTDPPDPEESPSPEPSPTDPPVSDPSPTDPEPDPEPDREPSPTDPPDPEPEPTDPPDPEPEPTDPPDPEPEPTDPPVPEPEPTDPPDPEPEPTDPPVPEPEPTDPPVPPPTDPPVPAPTDEPVKDPPPPPPTDEPERDPPPPPPTDEPERDPPPPPPPPTGEPESDGDPPAPAPTEEPESDGDPPAPAPTDEPERDPPDPDPTNRPAKEPTNLPMPGPSPTTDSPAPTNTPEVFLNGQPTSVPSTAPSIIQASLQFSPLETPLPDDDDTLDTWVDLTEHFITEQAVNDNANNLTSIQLEITVVSQEIITTNATIRRRLQQQSTLNITFDLQSSTIDSDVRLDQIFESVFDTESERSLYLERLKNNALLSDYFNGVATVTPNAVVLETESNQDNTDGDDAGNGMDDTLSGSEGDVNTNIDNRSRSGGPSSAGFIAVALVAVALSAVLVALFVWRRYYRTKRERLISNSSSPPSSVKQEVASFSVEPLPTFGFSDEQQQEPLQQQYTNDLVWTAPFDEISTLSGRQNATTESRVYDDPTATVDPDNFPYEYTQKFHGGAAPSDEATVLSRLSRLLVINDESKSFEALYARDILDNATDEGVKVHPFVLEVEPDIQLGLVVETNGGIPAVRAIRDDSPFYNKVQVGDILIAVNEQDVTNFTAMEASELIKSQQCVNRTLVFIRPETKLELRVHQADF